MLCGSGGTASVSRPCPVCFAANMTHPPRFLSTYLFTSSSTAVAASAAGSEWVIGSSPRLVSFHSFPHLPALVTPVPLILCVNADDGLDQLSRQCNIDSWLMAWFAILCRVVPCHKLSNIVCRDNLMSYSVCQKAVANRAGSLCYWHPDLDSSVCKGSSASAFKN